MGYHSFAAGEVLTAANVDTYLMNQVIIVATSSTRPTSPVTGMTVFETDTNHFSTYNGTAWVTSLTFGAWTTYTPTFGNLTSAAGNFAYKLEGKSLTLRGYFTAGSYTAQANATVSLPSGFTSITGPNQVLADSYAGAPNVTSAGTVINLGSQGVGVSVIGYTYNGVIEVA